jgi:hypothetical protein
MNEPQSAQAGPVSPAADYPPPASGPVPPRTPGERRTMAVVGGLLAGIGIGVALALLMHVIQQAQPGNFSGGGSLTAAVLLAGPLIGLGLGMAAASLVPDAVAQPAPQPQARPGNTMT